ncbi:MAG TPA: SDR family oxidoreductase [Acidimicrobiales bacterium]|nr:SDR family oxidoreductase [Acidimicrobiales bacterium]
MTGRWAVDVPHDRVVVTGGGSGIGRATTLALADAGVEVHVLGRRAEWLDGTARLAAEAGAPGRVVPHECDVRDPERVDAAFAAIDAGPGPATGLVHAAAQVSMLPARDIEPAEFAAVVEATLLAAFTVTRRWALPLLDAGTGGAAVLVTSSNASMGAPGLAHSSAGKAGTNALVKTLGREWGPHGITVNTVGPGPFPVEKSEAMWADERTRTRMFREVPLGRYGRLEEIVGPIVLLLSQGGGFTTGQCLTVDGGLSLQHWPLPPEEIANGQTVWQPDVAARRT